LYKKAADQGNAAAQCNLGAFYELGKGGLARDPKQAKEWYEKSADQGNAAAQCNLGTFYEFGKGGLILDLELAKGLYKKSADQGNAAAQCNLGAFYEFGKGGSRPNLEQARAFYEQSAAQGNAIAQFSLGLFYEFGKGGLTLDLELAKGLYKKAADQGNAAAQCNLGLFYESGVIAAQFLVKAHCNKDVGHKAKNLAIASLREKYQHKIIVQPSANGATTAAATAPIIDDDNFVKAIIEYEKFRSSNGGKEPKSASIQVVDGVATLTITPQSKGLLGTMFSKKEPKKKSIDEATERTPLLAPSDEVEAVDANPVKGVKTIKLSETNTNEKSINEAFTRGAVRGDGGRV
jgi:TPR repeat protein